MVIFVFPFALEVILKTEMSVFAKEKIKLLWLQLCLYYKKGHVPTTHTVIKCFITTPVVTLSIRGHKEHSSK